MARLTAGRDLLKLAAKAPAVVPEWRRLHMSIFLTRDQEDMLDRMETVADALDAVRREGQLLEFIPDELKVARVCIAAFQQTPLAIQYIPEAFLDADMCAEAVSGHAGNWHLLEYVPEAMKTPELCLKAVRQNGHALQWVPEAMRTRELCLAAVKSVPWGLEDLPDSEKTPELCMEAVSRQGEVMACIPESMRTPELVAAAKKAPMDPWRG